MKLQYLGDANDAFKYDLLHWLCAHARPAYRSLLIVPMLTPDDPTSPDGRKPHAQFPCRPYVRGFLEDLVAGPRDLRRLRALGRLEVSAPFEVEVFEPERLLCPGSERAAYWEGLEPGQIEDTLVFLDPDNGFEPAASRSNKHVLHEEVQMLVNGLGPRSSLVVYQHHPHQAWSDIFVGLQRSLHYAPYALAAHTSRLAFVILSGSREEYDRVQAAVTSYASDHPMVESTSLRAPERVVLPASAASSSPGSSRAQIFLEATSGGLVGLAEEGYETEDRLQDLLARYPNLLPGDQVDPESPRRWLLVDRELGIPDQEGGGDRWAIDHLFLDQDGIPTLIEVKRSTDGRIRREVLGQMLDYAANALLYWPVDRLRSDFETGCAARGLASATEIADLLGRSDAEDEFWSQVQDNLHAGRVRLMFVADKIPSELLRVVEFLNQQMDPAEVLALEIRQFLGEGRRILVPRLLGSSVTTRDRKQATVPRRSAWTPDELLASLRERGDPQLAQLALAIMRWGTERGCALTGGRGAKNPSIYLEWATPAGPRKPFNLYLTDAGLELYATFADLGPDFEQGSEARMRYCEDLRELSGCNLKAGKTMQSLPLGKLVEPDKQRALMEVLGRALGPAGFART
jgi:hypothetical protein